MHNAPLALPFLLVIAIYIRAGLRVSRPHKVLHQTLVLSALLLTLGQITGPLMRNLLALPLLTLVALNVTLSQFAWREYRSKFSYGFALSILDTTRREALGMLGVFRRYVTRFAVLLAVMLLAVNVTPVQKAPWPMWMLLLCLAALGIQAAVHHLRKNSISSPWQRIISDLPVHNLNPFLQALRDKRTIAAVSRTVPDYALTLTETGIENYVVVIGESARAGNMSVYGYPRPTTPELEARRDSLLLFTQAISATPVTATAIPLALTAATLAKPDVRRYADNLVNLANGAGFETHWYSRQGMYGDYSNAITGIAMNAHSHRWLDDGYDDALLPLLEQALHRPGKKLIVLHLYGCHEPTHTRYPDERAFFPTDRGDPDACYDNALRFTDSLTARVLTLLEASRASLLYFSDHAVERDLTRRVVYQHGGVKPSQQAFHVPMYLWFSPLVDEDARLAGRYDAPWSTVDNYALMSAWLGIAQNNRQAEPLRAYLARHETRQVPVEVMDTTGRVYAWHELKEAR
jgi:glucan phosphoethanolaminetransferase (alkaline phosphatase superfamily)